MPQNGFHGLVGLAAVQWGIPRAVRRAERADIHSMVEPLAAGIALGAMLPDIDLYPTAILVLLGHQELTYTVHRTFTHSLLAILTVGGLGLVLRQRSAAGTWACWGLALGMVTHVFLDAFFWFAPLDLFWPLSHLPREAPLLPVIDLWAWARPLPAALGQPDLLPNLLSALELAAFALYFLALRRLAQAEPKGRPADGLRRWERWAWASFAVALVGAFMLPNTLQETLVHVPYLLALAPYCWGQTVRLRVSLARWSLISR
jgi:membrane-bound metal-dependent hydrolase YbcI (DUF457 family)